MEYPFLQIFSLKIGICFQVIVYFVYFYKGYAIDFNLRHFLFFKDFYPSPITVPIL